MKPVLWRTFFCIENHKTGLLKKIDRTPKTARRKSLRAIYKMQSTSTKNGVALPIGTVFYNRWRVTSKLDGYLFGLDFFLLIEFSLGGLDLKRRNLCFSFRPTEKVGITIYTMSQCQSYNLPMSIRIYWSNWLSTTLFNWKNEPSYSAVVLKAVL